MMRTRRIIAISCASAIVFASASCGSDTGAGSGAANSQDVKWTVLPSPASPTPGDASTTTTVIADPNAVPADLAEQTLAASSTSAPADSIEPVHTLAIFGGAQSVACVANRGTIETALEAFLAGSGQAEATEADMIAFGLITEDIPGWEIAPGNVIVATPGGDCVG